MTYLPTRGKELSWLDGDLVLTKHANPNLSTAEIENMLERDVGRIERLMATKEAVALIEWADRNEFARCYELAANAELATRLDLAKHRGVNAHIEWDRARRRHSFLDGYTFYCSQGLPYALKGHPEFYDIDGNRTR